MKVLVISTQFPFPTHSGFTMRVYQLMRQLARRHDVALLSYARPDERQAVDQLRQEFAVSVVERVQRPSGVSRRVAQLRSILSARPYYSHAAYSEEMQRMIFDLCSDRGFDVVQIESSLLCGFSFPPGVRVVLDEHNIEYEVFRRMCEGERSLARRTFNHLEYRRFRRFEQRSWERVDGCVVTSEREQPIVRSTAPTTTTEVVPNGVDLVHFKPSMAPVEPHSIVFNGILDYRPNLDAAHHLVDDVWPLVLRRCPNATLTIVGRGHTSDIRRLRSQAVRVTGEVPDVRPYLQRAAAVAVPIRIGGGTRLKVVEGLAMGKALVSTQLGCEGIAVRDGEHLLIGDGAEDFAAKVVALFEDPALRRALGRAGRELIEREYSWDLAGGRLEAFHRHVSRASARVDRPVVRSTAPLAGGESS